LERRVLGARLGRRAAILEEDDVPSELALDRRDEVALLQPVLEDRVGERAVQLVAREVRQVAAGGLAARVVGLLGREVLELLLELIGLADEWLELRVRRVGRLLGLR